MTLTPEETKIKKREYDKAYYLKNKEKRRKQQILYRNVNRDVLIEKQKEYYYENVEQILLKKKEIRKHNASAISEQRKQYYRKNKAHIIQLSTESYQRHRNKVSERRKRKYLQNRESVLEQVKQYHLNHTEERLLYYKEYIKTSNGKLARKKAEAKRERELGYNYLNEYAPETQGHHLDKNNVVFIPTDIHTAYGHRQENEASMKRINILAWAYLEASVL